MSTRNFERLKEQDRRDAQQMAYAISAPLHHTTGTRQCADPTECAMCSNAARLAVQHYRPIIERRTVHTFVDYFGAGCTMPHGGD